MRMNPTTTTLASAGLVLALSACISTGLNGCGPTSAQWKPDPQKKVVAQVSFRQLPPEPVYARQRFVQLPEPLPAMGPVPGGRTAPIVTPILHLTLNDARLDDALNSLAKVGNFSAFSSPSVEGRRVTVNRIGTMEELVSELTTQTGASITIDNRRRELRAFLPTPPKRMRSVRKKVFIKDSTTMTPKKVSSAKLKSKKSKTVWHQGKAKSANAETKKPQQKVIQPELLSEEAL